MINFNEKVCICYTCSGHTYRKTTLDKLNTIYFDHPNLCYSIITDDKDYFKDVKLKNIIVEELKDFHDDFPHLEKYEWFIESTDVDDYAKKFVDSNYHFPFSVMRFHLLHAKRFQCSNVALLCTDVTLHVNELTDAALSQKDTIYNQEGTWTIPSQPYQDQVDIVIKLLEEKYGVKPKEEFLIFDGAARFYLFKDVNKMMEFFNVWHEIVTTLYSTDKMVNFKGWVFYNDEYILAPIYSMLGMIKSPHESINRKLFTVKHDLEGERFWACE
jgi:hypothetical protein